MNTTKITIDNRDLEHVHIDTYQMFTGDSYVEMELEHLCEEHNDSNLTYDDFDWEFDHPAIVRDLADNSINIIKQAISHTDVENVIKSITYVSSGSPKYYNYTTDHYIMEVEADLKQLYKYNYKNWNEISKILESYPEPRDGEQRGENQLHAAVCHLLNNVIEQDDYNMSMWELEHEVYMNNTTITQKATK